MWRFSISQLNVHRFYEEKNDFWNAIQNKKNHKFWKPTVKLIQFFLEMKKKIISSHCNFNKIKCMKWWTFQVYSTVKIDDCNSRWAWHLCASMCALAFDIFERNSLLQKSTVHKWYHSLVLSLYLIPKIIIIHGWVIY